MESFIKHLGNLTPTQLARTDSTYLDRASVQLTEASLNKLKDRISKVKDLAMLTRGETYKMWTLVSFFTMTLAYTLHYIVISSNIRWWTTLLTMLYTSTMAVE